MRPSGAFHCAALTALMEKCGKTGLSENKKTVNMKRKV
jgi:hypothetical protein